MYAKTTHYKTFWMVVEKKDSIEMLDFLCHATKNIWVIDVLFSLHSNQGCNPRLFLLSSILISAWVHDISWSVEIKLKMRQTVTYFAESCNYTKWGWTLTAIDYHILQERIKIAYVKEHRIKLIKWNKDWP